MPIIATASSRPATRNICTRSTGNSSGCRAEPSMKRPPRMPKPMAVPSAPMPKMMPTASTVMAWICAMFSIQLSLVMLVSHRQIDDRQHHEDEGLDGDDQDVKHRPDESEADLHEGPPRPTDRGQALETARECQSREQQENHLARVQV